MRKTPILLALSSLLCSSPLQAAFEFSPVDPKGLAMAGAMTAVTGSAFGIYYNPAAPASAAAPEAGISYAIPYGEANLGSLNGAFCLPRLPFDKNGAFSAGLNHYGTGAYQEQWVVAGYGRSVTSSIRAGISASRMSLRMRGLDNEAATGINVGLQAELKPGLIFGISSMNLNAPKIGEFRSPLPRTTLTGISCRLKTGSILTVNAVTDPDRTGRLLAAGDFPVSGNIHVMIGMATNPSLISAGAEFGTGALRATLAVSRNIDLGTTSSCGIAIAL
ncbi:MAG: hypothetical protein HGB22_09865 [Chlorobiaceae bacterium]|nr:hypothetical protein [Chlorobiaceae bacterium]